MADRDLGDMVDNFDEEVEKLKKTKMKVFGIRVSATSVTATFALLSTMLGGLYGGFQVYDDYMGMKEIIQEIDTDAITAQNNEIKIQLEQAIEYTRDIKNDLREDIMAIEATADRVEDDMRALEIRVNESLDAAEARIRATQASVEASLDAAEARIRQTQTDIGVTLTEVRADMDQVNRDVASSIRATEGLMRDSEKDVRDTMREVEERIDTAQRTLRTDLEMKLQEALDNPLAQ